MDAEVSGFDLQTPQMAKKPRFKGTSVVMLQGSAG